MRLAIDQRCERAIGHGRSTILFLQQAGAALALKTQELLLGEGGTQQHIGHQAHRAVERGLGGVHRDRALLERRAGAQSDREEADLFRQVERITRAGPFVEQVGRECGQTGLALGVGFGAGANHQRGVHHRNLMLLDDHELESVGEYAFRDLGQRERLWCGQLWRRGGCRLRHHGLPGKHHRRRRQRRENDQGAAHQRRSPAVKARSFLPSGTTVSTIFGWPATYCFATRWMSASVSDS